MLKFKQVVMAILVLFFIGGLFCGSLSASEPRKIKGFFIGMSIDDALENFKRLGFEGLSIRENTYRKDNKYYTIQPSSGDPFKIGSGMNTRIVSQIFFSEPICNRLFHTKGIGSEIFKKSFADGYDILDMPPFKDNPGEESIKGWEFYDLKAGYRIRIYLNKDLEIIRTDRAADFSFD